MWFHRPARADEWVLYAEQSPSAQSGRGLSQGRMFTAHGRLVASVAQEGMMRVKDAGPRPLLTPRHGRVRCEGGDRGGGLEVSKR